MGGPILTTYIRPSWEPIRPSKFWRLFNEPRGIWPVIISPCLVVLQGGWHYLPQWYWETNRERRIPSSTNQDFLECRKAFEHCSFTLPKTNSPPLKIYLPKKESRKASNHPFGAKLLLVSRRRLHVSDSSKISGWNFGKSAVFPLTVYY